MKKSRIPQAYRWVDKPTTIILGIPLDPSYMDGFSIKRGDEWDITIDRDGNRMSYTQRNELSAYRDLNREQWRESSANIIDKVEDE
jgi:hypothetical protein